MVHGKGRDEKDNFVVLTDKAYYPIKKYLASRKQAKPTEPLFVSVSNNSKGGRLTTASIRTMVKKGLRSIGLDTKEFSAHSLRHTTAVSILRQGGRLEDAQRVLRHSNPATTQIYLHSIDEEMRLKNPIEDRIDRAF